MRRASALIKSNNPHLAGGEKQPSYSKVFGQVGAAQIRIIKIHGSRFKTKVPDFQGWRWFQRVTLKPDPFALNQFQVTQ